MKPRIRFIYLLLAIQVMPAAARQAPVADHLPRGEVILRLECRGQPGQTYALFLPRSGAEPIHQAPWLFILDPGARGVEALEHFRAAAAARGVVLIASNSSRNGPIEDNIQAIRAMWSDSTRRLGGEPHMVYAAGFSGGSRAASLFNRAVNRPLTGIIGCGAGLSPLIRLEDLHAGLYCGVVGYEDFNYLEMRGLDSRMDATGLPHHFLYGPFGHHWPRADICGRALDWLLYRALLAGKLQIRGLTAASYLLEEARTFQARIRAGDLLGVAREAQSLTGGLTGSPAGKRIMEILTKTASSSRYRLMTRQESRRLKEELRRIRDFMREFPRLEAMKNPLRFLPALEDHLGIAELLRRAANDQWYYDSALALRLLSAIQDEAWQRGQHHHMETRNPDMALAFYRIVDACGGSSYFRALALYNSACILCRRGETAPALQQLHRAMEAGFRNLDYLRNDPDLSALRTNPRYLELIRTMEESKRQTGKRESSKVRVQEKG